MEGNKILQEVLETVIFIRDNAITKEEFDRVINGIKEDVNGIKGVINGIKEDVNGIKGELRSIRSVMVTKEYLDEKLADLRGDLIVLLRKEDGKLATLASILHKRKVVTTSDVKMLSRMEPFPRLAI